MPVEAVEQEVEREFELELVVAAPAIAVQEFVLAAWLIWRGFTPRRADSTPPATPSHA